MKIAYGLLSAWEPVTAVRELVDCLGTDDPIVLHHDFTQRPDFDLARPNVHVLPDPMATGWGSPGLVRGIFLLMRTALARSSFDYFQLLSGSCLPLKPMGALKRTLADGGAPIHADLIDLDADDRAMLSHGHRVLCRAGTTSSRVLGRSRRWCLGDAPVTIQQDNLGIEARPAEAASGLRPRIGRMIHRAARAGLLERHPFRGAIRPFVGSLWSCLRRDVCEYLVRQEHSNPVVPYLLQLKNCDEVVFATLLGNSSFEVAPSPHRVNDFEGPHPRLFTLDDLPTLRASDRYFARKFSTDGDDAARRFIVDLFRQRTWVHEMAHRARPPEIRTPIAYGHGLGVPPAAVGR